MTKILLMKVDFLLQQITVLVYIVVPNLCSWNSVICTFKEFSFKPLKTNRYSASLKFTIT